MRHPETLSAPSEVEPSRLVFMGTPDFAVPSLEALVDAGMAPCLVVTQPDRPRGRKHRLTPPEVKVAAEAHGLKVVQPTTLKGEEGKQLEATIRELSPDFLVTASYGHILPGSLLRVPRIDSINVHASLLPQYRGASPVQQAVIRGDEVSGVTIMRMVEAMDRGPIYAQERLAITPNMTAETLMDKLAVLAADMLPETLRAIANGTLEAVPQREEDATYVKKLTRETGAIDWRDTAQAIHNLIRGTYSWPGAYTRHHGERMKIHASELPEHISDEIRAMASVSAPGTIVGHQDGLYVQTGDGVLKLLVIQPAGKKRQRTEEVSHNYEVGDRFDTTAS